MFQIKILLPAVKTMIIIPPTKWGNHILSLQDNLINYKYLIQLF